MVKKAAIDFDYGFLGIFFNKNQWLFQVNITFKFGESNSFILKKWGNFHFLASKISLTIIICYILIVVDTSSFILSIFFASPTFLYLIIIFIQFLTGSNNIFTTYAQKLKNPRNTRRWCWRFWKPMKCKRGCAKFGKLFQHLSIESYANKFQNLYA